MIMRPGHAAPTAVERALGPLASPATGIVLWLALMYVWHIPALYDAAVEHPLIHLLEHVSFFTAGVALWWPLIQPVPMRRRLTGMQPLAYIASAKAGWPRSGCSSPGARTAIYPYYERTPRIWGLSPVDDQNVGGVIMMVEQSLTLVLVLVCPVRADAARSETEELRRERLEEREAGRSAGADGPSGALLALEHGAVLDRPRALQPHPAPHRHVARRRSRRRPPRAARSATSDGAPDGKRRSKSASSL